jgi:putrescine aminotransferase
MSQSPKPAMFTIEEAAGLSAGEARDLHAAHINPGMAKMMSMLGFADAKPVRSLGATIFMEDGREVLDFTGGVGVLNHGHNHPRILEARRRFAEEQRMEVWKLFPSPYQTALCANLARIFPEDLDVTFLCNSGAEANEGALKMAEKAAGPKRDLVVYTDISFHGKSHATLSVSGSEEHQNKHFKLLPGCIRVPHGDAEALERAFKDKKGLIGKTRVCAFIVEPVRSEGVVTPPEGYFKKVRELCDAFDVTLIFDEIYTGWGRTGKMFAFMHYEAVPDICCFSKSFGGGKATLAGYIARSRLFQRAYGAMKDATLHSTTFSGFGEECISAIESLHVLYDEGLVENAAANGPYLLERLLELKGKHPKLVKDARGIGYLACIRFENQASRWAKLLPGGGMPGEILDKLTTGGIITAMFEQHDILTFTPPHDFNILLITPSLIVTREQIDRYVDALDEVLKIGLTETIKKYMTRFLGK